MTPKEFADKMAVIAENYDQEGKHVDADNLMCDLLDSLGYGAGVTIYRDMNRWYA